MILGSLVLMCDRHTDRQTVTPSVAKSHFRIHKRDKKN